jgi:hypothetical protein
VTRVCKVSRGSFNPPPEVDSMVVKFVPRDPPIDVDFREWDGLMRIVFCRKRKTLSSSFKTKNIMKMLENNYSTWCSLRDVKPYSDESGFNLNVGDVGGLETLGDGAFDVEGEAGLVDGELNSGGKGKGGIDDSDDEDLHTDDEEEDEEDEEDEGDDEDADDLIDMDMDLADENAGNAANNGNNSNDPTQQGNGGGFLKKSKKKKKQQSKAEQTCPNLSKNKNSGNKRKHIDKNFSSLITSVLDDLGLTQERAITLDLDTYFRMLLAFNKKGVHFSNLTSGDSVSGRMAECAKLGQTISAEEKRKANALALGAMDDMMMGGGMED